MRRKLTFLGIAKITNSFYILIINTTANIVENRGRNFRNKLFSTILAVVFMIKIFTPSQVHRLPQFLYFFVDIIRAEFTLWYFSKVPGVLHLKVKAIF